MASERQPVCFAVAAALAFSTTPVAAQSDEAALKDSARQLGREGVRRYETGDFEGARQLFRQAYRLVPAPTLALREARALVKMSRLVEAAEAYARATSTQMAAGAPDAYRQAIAAAHVELDGLRPKIPRLLITVEGLDKSSPDLVVRLDGVDVPATLLGVERAVDPGTHHVQAVAAGAQPASEVVTLKQSEVRSVVLRVAPPAPRAVAVTRGARAPADAPAQEGSSFARTAGWATLGVGITGLAVGATTGVMAMDEKSSLEDECAGSSCPPSASDDLDAFRTLRTVSTIGFVGGALATGVGITLLLTSGDDAAPKRTAGVEPWVGLGRAGVRGTFR